MESAKLNARIGPALTEPLAPEDQLRRVLPDRLIWLESILRVRTFFRGFLHAHRKSLEHAGRKGLLEELRPHEVRREIVRLLSDMDHETVTFSELTMDLTLEFREAQAAIKLKCRKIGLAPDGPVAGFEAAVAVLHHASRNARKDITR